LCGGERPAECGLARGATVELNELFGIVYTVRDGKVADTEWFGSPADALKAVGLEE